MPDKLLPKIGNTKATAKYDLKMKPLNKNYRTP